MNKKKFIKILKEKLSILEENEVKDITIEYESIIDDKIKDGVSEEQAIKDFGDIDELVKGILKAYKINAKYTETSTDNLGKDFESLIKKGASKLSETTHNVINNIKESDADFSTQSIFEIILKVLVLLIIIAVLRIPFMIISGIGENFFNFAFFPANHIFNFCWHVIMFLVYALVCIFIGIAMFKSNVKKNLNKEDIKKESPKKPETKSKKSDSKKDMNDEVRTEEKKVNIASSKDESVVVDNCNFVNTKPDRSLGVLLTVIKVFVTIFFMIPLVFICVGLGIAIGLVVYYIFLGINLFGILFLLVGLFIFFSYLSDVLAKLFTNKKKHFLAPLIVSFSFIIFGSILTFESVRHFEYIDKLDYQVFEKEKETKLIDNKKISIRDNHNNIKKEVDETLDDGKLKIEYSFYDEMINVKFLENSNEVKIYTDETMSNKTFWKLYDDQIKNLKNDKIYSYQELHFVDIIIYGNTKTLEALDVNH